MLDKESKYNYIGWQGQIQASGKSAYVIGFVEHVEATLEDLRLGKYFVDLARIPFVSFSQREDKLLDVVFEVPEIVPSHDVSVLSILFDFQCKRDTELILIF